jgi:hypothetical protein
MLLMVKHHNVSTKTIESISKATIIKKTYLDAVVNQIDKNWTGWELNPRPQISQSFQRLPCFPSSLSFLLSKGQRSKENFTVQIPPGPL